MSDIKVVISGNEKATLSAEVKGGGSGGTSDYLDLTNKPSINGVELVGNKTSADLGVPNKISQLENDSGFITDISETLQGGTYIDVAKGKAETLYEYTSYFNESNLGLVTANNVTAFTNEFGGNNLSMATDTTQVDNPASEMYMLKIPETEAQYLVPLLKADKTPYTLLEVLTDTIYTNIGATDLTEEGKTTALEKAVGGNVDVKTPVYVLKMIAPSNTTSESILVSIYKDNYGNYILGMYACWLLTPVSETRVGEDTDYFVVDLNSQAKSLINQNTRDIQTNATNIQTLNDKVDNLPTDGAEYTAGSGITITNNVISSNTNIEQKGMFNYSTTYKAGEIVLYYVKNTNGYQYFMSIQDNNKGNYPSDLNNGYWAVLNNLGQLTYTQNNTDVPICMIKDWGSSGDVPNTWKITVPSNSTALANMPTVNSTTGLMKVPAGIDGYYTKAEVDALIEEVKAMITGS